MQRCKLEPCRKYSSALFKLAYIRHTCSTLWLLLVLAIYHIVDCVVNSH